MVAEHIDLEQAWKYLPHTFAERISRGSWIAYTHLVYISNLIAEAISVGRNLIILAPPRHCKSMFVSEYTPVYYLENFPRNKVILASYGANLAMDYGRLCRNHILENQDLLTVRIAHDSSSISRWHTTAGGSMISVGVGGSITGRGADLIIADDLVKNYSDAQSHAVRENLLNWFKTTLYTRLEPGGSFIYIQTRWTSDDLIGTLLREHPDQWTEVRLPAFAEEDDILGREPGEPLCPERFDVEALNEIREQLGTKVFNAMYQQNPKASGSQLFRKSWWRYCSPALVPNDLTIIQSWDAGYEKSENASYTVCVTIGRTEREFYILDVFRERLDFPELIRAVERQYEQFRPVRVLIESHAAGISLSQVFRDKGTIPIIANKLNNRSKQERAYEVTHLVEAGRVILVEDSRWTPAFIEELTEFPFHRYSDQVDAFTQGLQFLYRTNCRWVNGRPSLYKRPSSGRPPLHAW